MTYYFYECGICDCLHPCQFAGNCREDDKRFALDELEERYGVENVVVVPMDQADEWPAEEPTALEALEAEVTG